MLGFDAETLSPDRDNVTTHYLKCVQPHYADIIDCNKRVEVRYDDRNYAVGDILILMEYDDSRFTGSAVKVAVSHVLRGFAGLAHGYCAMSLYERGTVRTYEPDQCIYMHLKQQHFD